MLSSFTNLYFPFCSLSIMILLLIIFYSKQNIDKLITKIRKEIPDVILRTSLIVGFPGETKNDFEKLYEFVQKTKFDKLGVFSYSKEDGTPASKMQNQIHYKTKQARLNKITVTLA